MLAAFLLAIGMLCIYCDLRIYTLVDYVHMVRPYVHGANRVCLCREPGRPWREPMPVARTVLIIDVNWQECILIAV